MEIGDIVDYGSIICKITVKNTSGTSFVIKSEKGNIYKVRPKDIVKTTKIFKSKD